MQTKNKINLSNLPSREVFDQRKKLCTQQAVQTYEIW